ncbi:unnamed protein product [Linum trigynum]|uniref:Uncharacterized protein n=1 Tax=Linum trigynum TaxID=586398 RepID=A0AAV2CBE1_9ROSI
MKEGEKAEFGNWCGSCALVYSTSQPAQCQPRKQFGGRLKLERAPNSTCPFPLSLSADISSAQLLTNSIEMKAKERNNKAMGEEREATSIGFQIIVA